MNVKNKKHLKVTKENFTFFQEGRVSITKNTAVTLAGESYTTKKVIALFILRLHLPFSAKLNCPSQL